MEIGPIPGIRAFSSARAQTADFQLSAVMDIDAIAPPSDSARAGTRKKAAGAEELEADDLDLGGETADSPSDASGSNISFFA
jgi:hypothetical protein